MACEGQGKSDAKRIFSPNDLKGRPGIVNQLSEGADSVDEHLKTLMASSPRFINKIGQRIQCTTEGDIVKHAFDGLRSDLKLCGFKPSQVLSLQFVPELRSRMKETCSDRMLQRE